MDGKLTTGIRARHVATRATLQEVLAEVKVIMADHLGKWPLGRVSPRLGWEGTFAGVKHIMNMSQYVRRQRQARYEAGVLGG